MIRVSAPARIHINAADMNGSLGRAGVGFGFAVRYPRTVVEVQDEEGIPFTDAGNPKVAAAISTAEQHVGRCLPCAVKIVESIPQHVGLGSGTQLVLSVAVGLMRAKKLMCDIAELASWNCRGQHSGIGVAVFQGGGFVVDSGFKISAWKRGIVVPPLFRCSLPEDWKVVLAIPLTSRDPGLDLHTGAWLPGAGPSSIQDCEVISRELIARLMPAALAGDLEDFGAAIGVIGALGYKKKELALHGVEIMNSLMKTMHQAGSVCTGLSSGGPTVYGIAASTELAAQIAEAAEAHPRMNGGQIIVTSVDNEGASILEVEIGRGV